MTIWQQYLKLTHLLSKKISKPKGPLLYIYLQKSFLDAHTRQKKQKQKISLMYTLYADASNTTPSYLTLVCTWYEEFTPHVCLQYMVYGIYCHLLYALIQLFVKDLNFYQQWSNWLFGHHKLLSFILDKIFQQHKYKSAYFQILSDTKYRKQWSGSLYTISH